MNRTRRASAVFAALIGALVFGLSACTDAPPSAPRAQDHAQDIQAPASQPSDLLGLDVGGTLSGITRTVTSLLGLTVFKCETPAYGSVTQTIGRYGGTLKIGPHALYVPPGALPGPVAITASASAGSQVKVDFQPHGLRFEQPATLSLSYAHCTTRPSNPKIVYVSNLLSILELLPSFDDAHRDRVVGKIDHFSGYAFAD